MKLEDTIFRVADCETTGMDARDAKDAEKGLHRVVEVACQDMTLHGFGERYASLINPGRKIDLGAMAVHHITDAMVADAPELDEVWTDIVNVGEHHCLVFHNAEFDTSFLDPMECPVLCTLRLSRHLLPDIESHKNQYLRYYLGLGLDPSTPTHRAAGDVLVTAHILQNLVRRAMVEKGITDLETLIKWSEEPVLLKTCRFGAKHNGDPWSKVPISYMTWMLREVQDMDRDTRHTIEFYMDAHRARNR